MNSKELIQALQDFKEQKNVDKETMRDILESVFRMVLAKNYDMAHPRGGGGWRGGR